MGVCCCSSEKPHAFSKKQRACTKNKEIEQHKVVKQ